MERLGVLKNRLKNAFLIVFAVALVGGAALFVINLPATSSQPPSSGEEIAVSEGETGVETPTEDEEPTSLTKRPSGFQLLKGPEGYDHPFWLLLAFSLWFAFCYFGPYRLLVWATRLINDTQTTQFEYEYADRPLDGSTDFSITLIGSILPQYMERARQNPIDVALPQLRASVKTAALKMAETLNLAERGELARWQSHINELLLRRGKALMRGADPSSLGDPHWVTVEAVEFLLGWFVYQIRWGRNESSPATREALEMEAREQRGAGSRVEFLSPEAYNRYCWSTGLDPSDPQVHANYVNMVTGVLSAETERQRIESQGGVWRALSEIGENAQGILEAFARALSVGRQASTGQLPQFRPPRFEEEE